ncbi:MAG: hypothetical protein UDP13_07945 [Butyricicoccus sp.]|nr:hypothetical protein [Butyricicoccus sp.]
MIKITTYQRLNDWDIAVRAARNSWDSWNKSDSHYITGEFMMGDKDHALLLNLCRAGSDERKFLRMMNVYADITAPLYWWKQFDTYKVGTVSVSTSTMHTLAKHAITPGMFSLDGDDDIIAAAAENIYNTCESFRQLYLKTKDKRYWRALIQLLPSGFMQKRTVMLNYETLSAIYYARRHHRLSEWRDFCDWIRSLPYSEFITCIQEAADEN